MPSKPISERPALQVFFLCVKMVEKDEKARQESMQQQQQQEAQMQQQQIQAQMQLKQQELQQKEQANIRDNQTKLTIAQMQSQSLEEDGIEEPEFSEESKANLLEKMREFDAKIQLDKDKLEFDKQKQSEDASIKR